MINRRGFTLVEVALVVVVGLIILTGVYMGYQTNKDQAGNAIARERLMMAQGSLEAYVAAKHSLPESGSNEFSGAWAAAHPVERGQSPWGGPTGDITYGVSEDPPMTDGTPEAAGAPDKTGSFGVDGARQSNLHYVSITGNRWVTVTSRSQGHLTPVRGYVLAIYDQRGNPWQHVIGGR